MAHARTRTPSAVTPLARRRRREAWIALGFGLGVALAVLGLISLYLWLSWQRVYWADRVTEARAQLAQTLQERQFLEAEVAATFSLERLAAWARGQGMVEPELHYWGGEP